MTRQLVIDEHKWPLKTPFIIARSTRTEAHTISVGITEGAHVGRGECVALSRYGESAKSVISQILSVKPLIQDGLEQNALLDMLPPGAARNAIDAALWDLTAKITGKDIGQLSGLGWPEQVNTVQTVSILTPHAMGAEAARLKDFPVLKVKLNSEHVVARIAAVHENAPNTQLIVDANESWSLGLLKVVAPQLAALGVVMIEQPVKAAEDAQLLGYRGPLPIYADESCHTRADLSALVGKYTGINIKLDKTGGLTEGIALMQAAKESGFDIMLGCMLNSSLGIAPALFLAQHAKFVDVDGPALLAEDYANGLSIKDGKVSPLDPNFWGGSESPKLS